jgi:hypothetical protein
MPPATFYYVIAAYHHDCANDFKKSEDFLLHALSIASQDTAKVIPLSGLATVQWICGNYSRALDLAKETYRIARGSGNIRGELDGLRLQVLCYSSLGYFKQGLELLDQAKKLIIRAGLQGGEMEMLLMNLEAELYQMKTEYSDARRIHEAVLQKTSTELSPIHYAYAQVNTAFLDIVTDAGIEVVFPKLNGVMTAFRNRHYAPGISVCEYCHADLRHREGDPTGARAEYTRLFAATRDSDEELMWLCLAKLADPTKPVHADTESARWAFVFLAFALRPQVRSALTVHHALRRLGDTLVVQGAENTALSILAITLDGFTQMDVHQGRAECMRTIGNVYVRCRDLSKAQGMWEAARPLFERSEQKKEVIRIDERLQTLRVAQKFEALPKVELPAPQIPLRESDAKGEEQKLHPITDM